MGKGLAACFILACICLWGLCSCSAEKNGTFNEYADFKDKAELKADRIEVPPVLLYPRSVYLLNDKLVVLNEKTDTVFSVYNLPECSYWGQFGQKGQGPEDFNLPLIYAVRTENDSFSLFDSDCLKTIVFEDNRFSVFSSKFPVENFVINNLVYLKDGSYVCSAGFESEYELRYIFKDGTYKESGAYPEKSEGRFENVLSRNQAYSNIIVAKPDGSRLALVYQFIRRNRIYDDSGNLLSDNVMTLEPGSSEPALNDDERCIHAIAVYATDRYFYTLNLDMTAQELGTANKFPNIQVFDWNGTPVKQLYLDCYISSFVVDETNQILYGVFAEDDSHIYKFRLP